MVDLNYFLQLYDERIQHVKEGFKDKFGFENPIIEWRRGHIKRTGFLDSFEKNEYSLHGNGCTVEFENNEIISFDFSETDEYNIDNFKFQLFIDSLRVIDEKTKRDIKNMIQSKRIIKNNGIFEIR